MPKDESLHKVMVIGSGPIVIGQAAEFDYAGAQACRALREEGISVVLVNSNPATIMTDVEMADRVYIEPLTHAVSARKSSPANDPDGLLSRHWADKPASILPPELANRGHFGRVTMSSLLGTPVVRHYAKPKIGKRFRSLMQRNRRTGSRIVDY